MAATHDAKITLYTNHRCPWAHRAHIALKELGLQYEEVIIDLETPREQWYLDINPRGLVPTLKYNDEIIPESGIVTQFLADAYPSHLLPPSNAPGAALKRARINFFVDTWFSKVNSFQFQILTKDSDEEKEKLSQTFVDNVKKEIEPLLKDAAPFFGGSDKVTLAEALTASFIIRIFTLADGGLLPKSLTSGLNSLPNFSKWAAAAIKEESVTYIFDGPAVVEGTKKRIAKLKADAKL